MAATKPDRGRHKLLWAAGAAVLVAAAAAVITLWPARSGGARIDPDDPRQVALGRSVYAGQCASCHGERLEGQAGWQMRKPDGKLPAPPHDGNGHTWHHPDAQLFEIVKQGIGSLAPPGYKSDMPAYAGTLSDDEIRGVLAYIESTWPAEIRQWRRKLAKPAGG